MISSGRLLPAGPSIQMNQASAELELRSGSQIGRRLPVGDRFLLGSDSRCTLRIEDDTLGTQCLCIEKHDQTYVLKDLSESTGRRLRVPGAVRAMVPTPPCPQVNGLPLLGEQALKDGDRLVVGSLEVVFHHNGPTQEITDTSLVLTSVKAKLLHTTKTRTGSEWGVLKAPNDAALTTSDRERLALKAVMRITSDEENVQALLERVSDALQATMDLDRTVCVRHERLGDRYVPAVVRRGPDDPPGAKVGIPRSVLERCIKEDGGTLVRIPVQPAEGGTQAGSSAPNAGDSDILPSRSAAIVPLASRGRPLGAIYVDRSPAHPPPNEADLKLFTLVGRQVGLALERTQLLDEANRKAADLVNTTRELERSSTRVEAERAWLRAVIEGIDSGLIFLDPRGRVALLNSTATALLRDKLGVEDPDDAAALGNWTFATLSREVLDSSDARIHKELVIEAEDEDVVLEVRGAPVVGSGGPEGVALLVRDVSDERFRDARLRQSEKLSAIGEMMAGVAHELNNPLAAISGFVELLDEDLGQARAQLEDHAAVAGAQEIVVRAGDDVRAIGQEATRCLKVVRNLLGLARRREPERRAVDLNEVVTAIAGVLRPEARRRGVKLEANLATGLPGVLGDGHELQQVVYNLIMNAVYAARDANAENAGTVVVTTAARDENGVAVSVTDNGAGIEPGIIKRIFSPFFTTKPEDQGTGLGLPIAMRIAKAHNGQIVCSSELGSGTTFSLELPVLSSQQPGDDDGP